MTKSHMLAGAQPSLALQSQNSPSYAPLCSFTEWATKIKLDCHSTYKQVSLVTLHTNRLVWSVTLHTNRLVWSVTLHTNRLVWSINLFSLSDHQGHSFYYRCHPYKFRSSLVIAIFYANLSVKGLANLKYFFVHS